MKKNTMMRLAAVLLVVALLTTSVICGTFAKYTSADTATDSARVAKWDIQLNGENIAEEKFTFDLFKTIIDTKTDKKLPADRICLFGSFLHPSDIYGTLSIV